MEHPLTAHIECPAVAGGEWLREGEDYSSSDYEYDSDEEDYLRRVTPAQEVNESLTKKKYCQSAKLFYQVFSSLIQYESFLKFISKTKKYVFRVIFGLFMEAIPNETRYKIPEELWEKIWKFSQNAHFKYKSNTPINVDTTYYRAGLRSEFRNNKLKFIEVERINDMFGALGNIHMLVFEILYKNPHLLQPTPMLELEVGALSECFPAAVWREAAQMAKTSVLKLQQLDHSLSKDKTESGRKKFSGGELASHLDHGNVFISDTKMVVDENVEKLGPSASLLVSEFICPYVCIPGSYMMEDDRLGLMLAIIDVENQCEIVHKIRTPVRYEHHLIEVGSHRVIRKNESGWKRNFFLTKDRISFVFKNTEQGREVAKVFSVPLGGDQCEIDVTDHLLESVMEPVDPNNPKPSRTSRSVFVSHSSSGLLVLHQSPYSVLTRLTVNCVKTGETLLSVPFQEDVSLLNSCCNTRVLLRSTSRCILLFSLQSGEVVYHWKESDLNATFNLPQESSWSAMFDSAASKPQICLYTKTLSGFSLHNFDMDNEMIRPTINMTGSIPEGVLGLGTSSRLLNGNLITNTSLELLGVNGGAVKSHQLSSYCLTKKTKYNILSMGVSANDDESMLNINSRKWMDDSPGICWDPERRPVFALSKTKIGILLETGDVFRILDLGLCPADIISKELQGSKSSNNVSKMEEIKRKKLEISKELSENGDVYVGTVIEWKGTYGFMKSSGKAKQLGKIFFHLNDVQNKQAMKKSLKKGQKLEFKIVYNSCDESFKTSVYKCINN